LIVVLHSSRVSYDYIEERFGFEAEERPVFAVLKDVNFAAKWDLTDYEYCWKTARKMQALNDAGSEYDDKLIELQEHEELKLIRMLDGQYVQDIPTDPKPTQAAIKIDVVTNQGLVRVVSVLTNKTTQRFTHYASGDGQRVATSADTKLLNEKFRISMGTDGFITAAGTVARYGAVFIPSAPSHTIAEAGVVDSATPGSGTFLNRTLYLGAQRIVHTIFEDFYTLSIALYSSAI
jgi:hypothetical protein